MQIGQVIRKYRKQQGLTQEETARYLGVTAPAVNKWENGSSMPDIGLLAPICRLLGVPLEELLGFREKLTEQEQRELVRQLDELLAEDFEAAYEWARARLAEYPNCEPLLHSFAVMLDANRVLREAEVTEKQEAFILGCYKRLLQSKEAQMRTLAADALYGYYLRQEDYDRAAECLEYFSEQNPVRKMKQAKLYERTDESTKACRAYEEILFEGYQLLNCVFNSLLVMAMKASDLEAAKYYAAKQKGLARLFEMGEYHIWAVDLELVQAERDVEGTLNCVGGLLNSVGAIHDFVGARLFSHMSFRELDLSVIEKLREKLLLGFRDSEDFGYMQADKRWQDLLGE